jgi:hypothetical protein
MAGSVFHLRLVTRYSSDCPRGKSVTGVNAFTQTRTPDLTALLLSCGLLTESSPRPGASPPRIHSKSQHFRFALYVLAGYSYEDACALLDINPRTAERWRTDLRRAASRCFGRRVTYEFAARYALDPALRHACETAARHGEMSVRGSPR